MMAVRHTGVGSRVREGHIPARVPGGGAVLQTLISRGGADSSCTCLPSHQVDSKPHLPQG